MKIGYVKRKIPTTKKECDSIMCEDCYYHKTFKCPTFKKEKQNAQTLAKMQYEDLQNSLGINPNKPEFEHLPPRAYRKSNSHRAKCPMHHDGANI